MKKIILLLAISFCVKATVHSQSSIGITGGVSIANMDGQVDGDSKAGLMLGLMLEAPLCKSFKFRPSLSYVQKGVTLPHPPGTLIDDNYLSLRYAEFTTDFIFYPAGNAGFFLGAGPSIAFNLPSKKVEITDDVKVNTGINFGTTTGDDMRGFDYGANFTAGYRMAGGFLITVNYNKGLRNLVTEGVTGHLKNSYFGFQLGYFLNNGKPAK